MFKILKFKKDDCDIESICFYYLYRHPDINNEYLLCFIVDDNQYSLDLYPFLKLEFF